MWRVAAKKTAARYPILQQSVRNESLQVNTPQPRGYGKAFLGLALTTGAIGATGTVVYAYNDPEFRHYVEHHVPPSKKLFDILIKPAETSADETQQTTLKELKELHDAELAQAIHESVEKERIFHSQQIGMVLEKLRSMESQLHDAKAAQAIQESVEKERRLHSKQIGVALEKLRAMEVALESRTAMDSESRRSKHYWLACQNLLESIIYGQKSGSTFEDRRKPLDKEIGVIASACENDEFVSTVAKYFPPNALQQGVYTEEDLKNRFKKVYKLASRTASVDEAGGGLAKYVSSWVQSLFIIELPRVYKPDDAIVPAKLNNREIISRVRSFVDQGDFLSAVRLAQLLRGEPSRIAKDWIEDARAHLEARFLADLLLSHSAATSIRTIY